MRSLIALLLLVPSLALACTHAEYAQYKDRAQTPEGRLDLADRYCVYRLNAAAYDISPIPAFRACRSEADRIMDALRSSPENGAALERVARMCGKYAQR